MDLIKSAKKIIKNEGICVGIECSNCPATCFGDKNEWNKSEPNKKNIHLVNWIKNWLKENDI